MTAFIRDFAFALLLVLVSEVVKGDEVQHRALAASIASGQVKASSELTVEASSAVKSTDFVATAQKQGSVWLCAPGDFVSVSFAYPAGATNPRLRVREIGWPSNDQSKPIVKLNDETIAELSPQQAGTPCEHRIEDATTQTRFKAGRNVLKVGVRSGSFGLQAVFVEYDLPVPSITWSENGTTSSLRLLKPLPGEILAVEPPDGLVTIAWECLNPTTGGVTLLYHFDGRDRIIPGTYCLPFDNGSADSKGLPIASAQTTNQTGPRPETARGQFSWKPPVRSSTLEIKLRRESSKGTVTLTSPDPSQFPLTVTSDNGVTIEWKSDGLPSNAAVSIIYSQSPGRGPEIVPGAYSLPLNYGSQDNPSRGSYFWRPSKTIAVDKFSAKIA